jgi:hypothetical protein
MMTAHWSTEGPETATPLNSLRKGAGKFAAFFVFGPAQRKQRE